MKLQEIIENFESIYFGDLRKTALTTNKPLAREVQSILKKIGIYKATVDGEFGPISRVALQDFIETENISQDYLLNEVVAEFLLNRVKPIALEDFSEGKEAFVKETIRLCREQGLPMNEQIAYVLATAEHETFKQYKPVIEAFWVGEKYRKSLPYYPYYGRGYVQLTHKYNYEKFGRLLSMDLLSDLDVVLEKKVSMFVLVYGMSVGLFSGKRLGEYVNKNDKDFVHARKVVNGRDKAKEIAVLAEKWLEELVLWEEPRIQCKSIGVEAVPSDAVIQDYKRRR
jgi:hypothetical protein